MRNRQLGFILLAGAFLPSAVQAGNRPPPIVVTTDVRTSPEAVWKAWTSEAGVITFFAPAARIESRIGGAYEIYFLPDRPPGLQGSETATILAMEAPKRLMVSWNAPESFGGLREQLTVVEIEIEPLRDGETRVTLVHSGWGRGDKWQAVRDYFASAWPMVLARLTTNLTPNVSNQPTKN